MPLQATSGAASYDAFGGGAAAEPNYIESCFSTYLYTGTNAALTITNNIDLSTKGGLVWLKNRATATVPDNSLFDTARGSGFRLVTNSTAANDNFTGFSFSNSGFALPANLRVNENAITYASWTFRKQPKFFDIQTWTGTGANRTISHALGSVPACIMVKRLNATGAWQVYHRSFANTQYLVLNDTASVATGGTRWNSTTPTDTVFSVGTDATVNASGGTYVAYIFAHNAGGFGSTGTDNVISCGSFTSDSSGNATVNLGYEPQWILYKPSSSVGNWEIADTMRGWNNTNIIRLYPDSSTSEGGYTANTPNAPTATGFTFNVLLNSSSTYIYIAIRRGPMKVPTTASSVFGLSARSGTGANATVTGGQIDDAVLIKNRGSAVASLFSSRLTGTRYLVTSTTDAEVAAGATELQANPWDVMDGVKVGTTSTITNASANTYINYLFKRAPNFFDVCAYTGTGTNTTISHNLQAVPELIIVKKRSGGLVRGWFLYVASLTSSYYIQLNSTGAATNSGTFPWNSTTPTSSVFSVTSDDEVNGSANTYVAYLFATLAGVSKVGTFTGNGTTQTIDCGLIAGARFVLLKRTDSTGGWYVYDTARGMTVLTDPYWFANTTAAEVATLGSVTTVATGFALNSTILAAINVNAATYIFLAVG